MRDAVGILFSALATLYLGRDMRFSWICLVKIAVVFATFFLVFSVTLVQRRHFELKPLFLREASKPRVAPTSERGIYVDAGCFHFHCDASVPRCDSDGGPDWDGPDPPCCSHILREMVIDLVMFFTRYRFVYYASMGTLLGIIRKDRVIAWTADQDLIVNFTELVRLRAEKWRVLLHEQTGLTLLFEGIDRVCATSAWRNGALLAWEDRHVSIKNIYREIYHYIDLYSQTTIAGSNGSLFYRIGNFPCKFSPEILLPYQFRSVYKNSLLLAIPRSPESYLEVVYGPRWRIPDPTRDRNGHYQCSPWHILSSIQRH